MTKAKDDGTIPDLSNAAPEGIALSKDEQVDARKDGAKQAVKDQAADTYKALTDGALPGEPVTDPYLGSDESQMYAYMLDDGADAFVKRLTEKDSPITDTMAAGLLKLERNGQNRTIYVKALMKRLGRKGKDELLEVADGGPDYTNDQTNISDL